MKFVSKNSNLRVMLKPGLPAQPMIGVPATPGISVKFSNGIVDVKEEEVIKMMLAHPGLDSDFIVVDDEARDPFAYNREEIEPVHVIQKIKYGHVDGSDRSQRPVKIAPELQAYIDAQAMELARKMVPGMVDDVLKKFAEESKARQEQAAMEAKIEESKLSSPVADPEPIADDETEDLRINYATQDVGKTSDSVEESPKKSIMEILGKSKK